jgi:hypothetical protein
MAPKPHKLGFIFAAVLVMAGFLAITTWAAVPKTDPTYGRCTSSDSTCWLRACLDRDRLEPCALKDL